MSDVELPRVRLWAEPPDNIHEGKAEWFEPWPDPDRSREPTVEELVQALMSRTDNQHILRTLEHWLANRAFEVVLIGYRPQRI